MSEDRDGVVAGAVHALDRLTEPGTLGVAVSGGSDSMALLALAIDRDRARVRAATVDHGQRPGAAAEAAAVAAFCAAAGVPHATLAIGPLPATGNLAANLRAARYAALADWAAAGGVGQIALGHTLDDQAETVLMRLARGAGADGLSGMAARRESGGVAWLRPLLGVRREALRGWLRARGIGWSDDPTNDDEAFERIKARRALAALAPLGITAEGLAATAARLRSQRAILERAAAEDARRAALPAPEGEARLDRRMLREAPCDSVFRVLAGTLARIGGRPTRPRQRALEPLCTRIRSGERFRATLAGCLVDACEDAAEVRIRPEPAASRTA